MKTGTLKPWVFGMDDALATLHQQQRQRLPATLIRLLGSFEVAKDSRPSKCRVTGASQKARSGVSPLEVPMRILFVANRWSGRNCEFSTRIRLLF